MQFVHPLWLFGLVAIAIPIIIHLFNFRRHKRYYFTNIRFLKSIKKETRKQHRLRHLLVLISRILAIAFLVLAFARPYIPGSQEMTTSGADRISIYIDNSLSMQAAANGHSLLDEALIKAGDIALAHKPSDRFQLITNDFEGRHQAWYNRDEFISMLKDVRITSSVRKTDEIVERMNELSKDQGDENRRLYLLSDMQKSSTQLDKFFEDTSTLVFLVPMLQNELTNLYIDSCWMASPFNHEGKHQEMIVRINNASDISLEKIPVKLAINGSQRALASFDIGPDQSTEVSLPFTNRQSGFQQATLSIDDYPISWDDDLYASWNVKDRIPVLVICEQEAGYYLRSILSNDSVFIYHEQPGSRLIYSDFAEMDLIILDNIKSISSGLSAELSSFAEAGGSLLLIPSSEAELSSINLFLASINAGKLQAVDTNMLQVTGLNPAHEIFAEVFESIPENLDLPRVLKHYPHSGFSSMNTSVIMDLQNADPFATLTHYGKGRVYLLTSPAEETSGNLIRHALWVPLLYRIAMLSRPVGKIFYTIGEDLSVKAEHVLAENDNSFLLKLDGSDYEFIPGYRAHGSFAELYLYDQVNTAGHYTLGAGERKLGGYAFNYNRLESDPAILSSSMLENELDDPALRHVYLIEDAKVAVNEYVSEFNGASELWRLCIWLFLLFILFEIALLRFWPK